MAGGSARHSGCLTRQELARVVAPVCYALRKARGLRPPATNRCAKARLAAEPRCPTAPRPQFHSASSAGRTRPRDARRADVRHARLSAKGLRCKALRFVPKDYIFLGPGPGWVPAKRGRRGRKGLRPVHQGRKDRFQTLPSAPRRHAEMPARQAQLSRGRCLSRGSCVRPSARFPGTSSRRC